MVKYRHGEKSAACKDGRKPSMAFSREHPRAGLAQKEGRDVFSQTGQRRKDEGGRRKDEWRLGSSLRSLRPSLPVSV